jgi:hypothetical protein
MRPTIPRRLVGRTTTPADADTSLRIDHYLPAYDAVSRRHIVVDAPPGTTYDAALSADLTRLGPVVGVLGALRAVSLRLGARLRGTETSDSESVTFGDLPARGTWVRLDDTPPDEFIFGAVGKVWRPNIEWVDLDRESFRTFDRPGYAKLVAGLSFRPYGRERTLVSYEARTRGTSPDATWLFRQYWRVVSPFVGYILGQVVRRIEADAETRAEAEAAATASR